MSHRNAIFALLLASLASLALSIGISTAAQDQESPQGELGVEWAYRPASLGDLVDQSPAIVYAEVEAVRPGPEAVLADQSEGGEDVTVPTQLVDVSVSEVLDGDAPSGLTIYQVGGPGYHADGDPAYVAGERYLLFIRPRLNDAGTAPNADETWLPVAPDGRLERVSGELEAKIEGPVGTSLDGLGPQEAEAEIADPGQGDPAP